MFQLVWLIRLLCFDVADVSKGEDDASVHFLIWCCRLEIVVVNFRGSERTCN